MFTKKYVGPANCASCEKGIVNLIGQPVDYYAWKRLPFREPSERIARVSSLICVTKLSVFSTVKGSRRYWPWWSQVIVPRKCQTPIRLWITETRARTSITPMVQMLTVHTSTALLRTKSMETQSSIWILPRVLKLRETGEVTWRLMRELQPRLPVLLLDSKLSARTKSLESRRSTVLSPTTTWVPQFLATMTHSQMWEEHCIQRKPTCTDIKVIE